MIKKSIFLVCLLLTIYNIYGVKYYYYHPEIKIGSEAFFNPVSMSINGGFDILRNGAHDKRLTQQYYQLGFKNLRKALNYPNKTIKQSGWDQFLSQEFPNIKLKREKLNFMPNFPIHTIGEGMRYKKTAEWYDYHDFPLPHTLALMTSLTYQLFNETLEQGDTKLPRTDPIADVYFYNNLGFILFSMKPVNQFFSETFVINDWSLQPMYNPFNDNVENAGEQYMGKLHIKNDYSLFCYWGMDFLVGTSIKNESGHSYSFGVGQIVNKIDTQYIDGAYVPIVSTIDPAFGVFYDYNNSLLANTHFSFNKHSFKMKSNIYPGFVEFYSIQPGIFTQFSIKDSKLHEAMIGFSVDKLPFGIVFGESKENE